MIVSYMIFVNVDLPDALDHDAESVQVAMLDVKDGFQFRVWCDTEHGEHVWVEGAPQPEKRAAFRIFWQTLSAVFGRRLESFMTA